MGEAVAVVLIVGVALVAVGRFVYKGLTGSASGCSCGAACPAAKYFCAKGEDGHPAHRRKTDKQDDKELMVDKAGRDG